LKESAAARPKVWSAIADNFLRRREASILVVAIGLVLYFQVANSVFLSPENIATVAQFAAPWAIIAAGEVMLLICGEIDLSVGQVFALAPFVMNFAFQAGIPLVAGVIIALIASALVGLINGVVTVVLRVPSFVTTLGTLFLLNGLTLTVSNGFPVLTPGSGAFSFILGHGTYAPILWAIGIMIAVQVLLTSTRWGLHTIATGGNLLGASESGVNTRRIKVGNFMLTSVLGGLAGILTAVRITSIDPLAGGTDVMFRAVAAAVIGGTALAGGSGTVAGAFLGALVLATIFDGFTLLGVSAFTFDMILGAAILLAMILNVYLARLRRAGK
jgi:simple sugar transport system permease protein